MALWRMEFRTVLVTGNLGSSVGVVTAKSQSRRMSV